MLRTHISPEYTSVVCGSLHYKGCSVAWRGVYCGDTLVF